MKKNFTLLFASVLVTGSLLAGCNPNTNNQNDQNQITLTVSGPTSVEIGTSIRLAVNITNDTERLGYSFKSSDENIATVTSEGIVTGVSTGTVTITVASRKDETVNQEYVIDVSESSIPTLSISTETPSIILSNNGGTALFTANIYNPDNLDVELEWSSKYNKGTFIGNGANQQQFRPFSAGTDVITLDAYIGPYHLQAEYDLFVKQDYTGWTAISTPEELIDFVTNANLIDNGNPDDLDVNLYGNYYLANDIDLEGYTISPSKRIASAILYGTFDGRGHSIKNFVVEGEEDSGANGGLFEKIGNRNGLIGTVRNLALYCEIGEKGSGWGTGSLAPGNDGIIENCYFEVNHSYDTGKKADGTGYVPFCAAVTGSTNGITKDVVVNVLDTEGKATIYADHAYPTFGQDLSHVQTAKVQNFYTNHTAVGGQVWDWGYPILDQTTYTIGIDFTTALKEIYDLNELVWTINDGEIPTLKVQE